MDSVKDYYLALNIPSAFFTLKLTNIEETFNVNPDKARSLD